MEVIDLDEVFGTAAHDKNKGSSPVLNRKNKKSEYLKKSIIMDIVKFILGIAIVVSCAFLFVEFVGQRTEVNGSSMETTMSDKDSLIVDKISYRFSSPKRFDIIVFPHVGSDNKEVYYIKRIIGMPGETVQISNGTIFINDVPLEEDYGCEVIKEAKLAASPIKLGEDEYFVLGDNRNHSSDSREFGAVGRDIIVGRAIFRIFPINKFGKLK